MTIQRNEYGYITPRFGRTDVYANGECWRFVAYFDLDALTLVDCEINPLSPDYDAVELAEQLTGWCRQCGSPGKQFLNAPYAAIQRKRNRIMVRQFGGLDI
jgi:hypothetical protein